MTLKEKTIPILTFLVQKFHQNNIVLKEKKKIIIIIVRLDKTT